MPLDRRCDTEAVSNNIKIMMDEEGKPQDQAVAIALSVLKKSCGVDSKERMSAKQIVASGRKEEARKTKPPYTEVGKYKLRVHGFGSEDLAKQIEKGIKTSADLCKISPPVCVGNLGIPRSKMPQLSDPVLFAFIRDLKDEGTRVRKGKMHVGRLKATQRGIDVRKSLRMAKDYQDGKFPKIKNQIIVSKDDHVLDGHHRWAALVITDPNETMNVLKVDLPMQALLAKANAYEGVTARAFGEAKKYKPPAAPPEVQKHLGRYYSKCRERGGSEEYCARVAWNIYCTHKNPDYEGCTEYGKKWGPPYSAPLTAKKAKGKEKKGSPKEEEAFGLAGPPKIYNPVRVKPATKQPKRPVHRKAKSGKEQPFIDPEDFSVQAPVRAGAGARARAREDRMGGFADLMKAIHEDKNKDRDGSVRRTEFDVSRLGHELSDDDRGRLEAFVLANTPEAHKFMLANGGYGIVYHDPRGRAVHGAIDDILGEDLLWLARSKGWKGSLSYEKLAQEEAEEDSEAPFDLAERKFFGGARWRGDLLPAGDREKVENAIWKKLSRKGHSVRTSNILKVMLNAKLARLAGLSNEEHPVNLKSIADAMLIRIATGLGIDVPTPEPAYEEVLDERMAGRHIAKDLSDGIDIMAYKYANTSRQDGVDVKATLALSRPMAPLIVSHLITLLKQRAVENHIHLTSLVTKAVQMAAKDTLGISARPDHEGEERVDRAIRLLVSFADGRAARVAKKAAKKLRKAKTFDDIGAAFQASA